MVNNPQQQLTACISNSGFNDIFKVCAINRHYRLLEVQCFLSATTHTRKRYAPFDLNSCAYLLLVAMRLRLLIEHPLLSFPVLALRLFPSGLLLLARPLVDVLADQLVSSAIKDVPFAVDIDRPVETSNRQVRVAPVITGYAFNFCRVHCSLVA